MVEPSGWTSVKLNGLELVKLTVTTPVAFVAVIQETWIEESVIDVIWTESMNGVGVLVGDAATPRGAGVLAAAGARLGAEAAVSDGSGRFCPEANAKEVASIAAATTRKARTRKRRMTPPLGLKFYAMKRMV